MDQCERVQLVELSEAKAYSSLVQCKADGASAGDFGVYRVGTAWVIISTVVTRTLNFNRVIGLGLERPTNTQEIDEISGLYRQ